MWNLTDDWKNTDLKPSNILLELDDPETVISGYLDQTSARTSQSIGRKESAISIPLSEVVTTPLLSKIDNIRVRIIDFGVCMLFFSCSLLLVTLKSH